MDKYGLPTIDRNSHIARAQAPDGKPQERMLRRAFNYDMQPDYAPISETGFVNDEEELSGTDVQLSNSGLVFICFQKDMTKVLNRCKGAWMKWICSMSGSHISALPCILSHQECNPAEPRGPFGRKP